VTLTAGLGTEYVDAKLRNGVRYRYVVVAVDAAGNRSPGVTRAATPLAQIALGLGRTVGLGQPFRLGWDGVKGAAFYNVQLYLGAKKVLSVWPEDTALDVRAAWRFGGKRMTLVPGRYTWYVWPAFGSRARPTYGDLLGKSTIRVPKPRAAAEPAARRGAAR
jgi:hypothetical protein